MDFFCCGFVNKKSNEVSFYYKKKVRGNMYIIPICFLSLGIFLFALNVIIFLEDYKASLLNVAKKNKLIINCGILMATVGMIFLGIIAFLAISNQLK